MVPWIAPTVPPETATLRAARQELEQGLQPPKPAHVQWCVRKLFSLPSRNGDAEDAAFLTEAFIDACGDYPDDLWTLGTTELLKTKTFRPSPAELVAAVDPKLRERQRMLERVKQMLSGPAEKPKDGPFVPEPIDVRVRSMRDSFRRVGNIVKAAKYEHELAGLESREVETWAVEAPIIEPRPEREVITLPDLSPEARARMMLAAAAWHRKEGRLGMADLDEREARKLAPQLFEAA